MQHNIHYTAEQNPLTPQYQARMKGQKTPQAGPHLQWLPRICDTPSLNAVQLQDGGSKWCTGPSGHTALCAGGSEVVHPHPTGCQGLLSSPHNTQTPFDHTKGPYILLRETGRLLSTKSPVLNVLLHTWGRWADVSTRDWVSTDRWWSDVRDSHLCTGRARMWGTLPGGLGQGQGVRPQIPSPPETNPGVHPH